MAPQFCRSDAECLKQGTFCDEVFNMCAPCSTTCSKKPLKSCVEFCEDMKNAEKLAPESWVTTASSSAFPQNGTITNALTSLPNTTAHAPEEIYYDPFLTVAEWALSALILIVIAACLYTLWCLFLKEKLTKWQKTRERRKHQFQQIKQQADDQEDTMEEQINLRNQQKPVSDITLDSVKPCISQSESQYGASYWVS